MDRKITWVSSKHSYWPGVQGRNITGPNFICSWVRHRMERPQAEKGGGKEFLQHLAGVLQKAVLLVLLFINHFLASLEKVLPPPLSRGGFHLLGSS